MISNRHQTRADGDIIPFPEKIGASMNDVEKMKLNIASGDLDKLIHGIKGGKPPGKNPPKTRLIFGSLLALIVSIFLFATGIWAHLTSLSILERQRFNPDNLDYEQLVVLHTAAARQASHLALLTYGSFAFGFIVISLLSYTLLRNTKVLAQ